MIGMAFERCSGLLFHRVTPRDEHAFVVSGSGGNASFPDEETDLTRRSSEPLHGTCLEGADETDVPTQDSPFAFHGHYGDGLDVLEFLFSRGEATSSFIMSSASPLFPRASSSVRRNRRPVREVVVDLARMIALKPLMVSSSFT
jgi:hypothetical protein